MRRGAVEPAAWRRQMPGGTRRTNGDCIRAPRVGQARDPVAGGIAVRAMRGRHEAVPAGRASARRLRGAVDGQDARAVRGDGDAVLPVGGQAAVARLDGPAVRPDADLVAAEREHRLDGQAQAGLDAPAAVAGAEVGDLRLLVHLGADAVAHERAHHAVAVLPGRRPRRRPRCRRGSCRLGRRDARPAWPGACPRRGGARPADLARRPRCGPRRRASRRRWRRRRSRRSGPPRCAACRGCRGRPRSSMRDAQGVAVRREVAGHADERGHAAALADEAARAMRVELERGDAGLERLARRGRGRRPRAARRRPSARSGRRS